MQWNGSWWLAYRGGSVSHGLRYLNGYINVRDKRAGQISERVTFPEIYPFSLQHTIYEGARPEDRMISGARTGLDS